MGAATSNPAVFQPAKFDEAKIADRKIPFAYAEAKGRRKEMEDVVHCQGGYNTKRLVQNIAWFAIFDGHGGTRVAQHCAKHMYERFMNTASMKTNELTAENINKGLREAFRDMDDEVETMAPMLKASKKAGSCFGKREMYETIDFVGTTATAVVLTPTQIHFAHVGDSRALYVSDGKIKYATVDHHPDNEKEKARITGSNGKILNNRIDGALAVSRAIGDFVYKRDLTRRVSQQWVVPIPEIQSFDRSNKDEFVIVASDGIWSVMSNEEVIQFIKERIESDSASLNSCVEELVQYCINQRRAADNISVALIKL